MATRNALLASVIPFAHLLGIKPVAGKTTKPEYSGANRFNHEPRRPRRLLLHRRQIDKLLGAVRRDGRTIISTRLYWNDKGLAKLELALAKGKTAPDKRHTEAERDWKREQGRLMRDKG